MIRLKFLFLSLIIIPFITSCAENDKTQPVGEVLIRLAGRENADRFRFHLVKENSGIGTYSVKIEDGRIDITGNTPVALCRGAYDYLFNACGSIVSWSGNRITIPEELPGYHNEVTSPYKYHYYFNAVTHGYTTPFWDWQRWEKEIDWMAVHGIDMPLIGGAHEAILNRVFRNLGLTQDEIDTYFTGPAYFPWNRMGNLTGWTGPFPPTFFDQQILLNHKLLNRMKDLGITPIIPAFAGFVPEGITRLYPDENLRNLGWGGFDKKYQAHILEPGSALFIKIGNMYIREWEKEFGKAQFYIADSFNEMDVPLSDDSTKALEELAKYGKAVFQSIREADPEATWVMQGWTFPYQKKNGKLFWTPGRLNALISEVPDDKLLILDLANEYNLLFWKIDPSWKMYRGFFGKQWIYSFIPNMGGKVSLNGNLDIYASASVEALTYENKGNLAGFGFAPEGIENNEIIYELLSEMGWSDKAVDLNNWIPKYCRSRYGSFPAEMKTAFDYLRKSCFGGFTDHPRHRYQFRPNLDQAGLVNDSPEFEKGVAAFLACRDELGDSELYRFDVIELAAQYLGLKADAMLKAFIDRKEKDDYSKLDEALGLLSGIDRLLESHPNHRLSKWIQFARNSGITGSEKDYYEHNARRLITTWGGWVNEYSARTWSGLIRDYYLPRWKFYFEAEKNGQDFDIEVWEEDWINASGVSAIAPFEDPVAAAVQLFEKYGK